MIETQRKFEPRKLLIRAAIVGALMGVAYTYGRYSVPERVVTKTEWKVKQVETEKVEVQAHIEEARVAQVNTRKRVRREVQTIRRPDGTVETKKTTAIDTDQAAQEQQVAVQQVAVQQERTATVTSEGSTVKVVEAQKPQWQLTAMVGIQATSFLSPIPTAYYGGMVQRTVAGPLHAGVWVLVPPTKPTETIVGAALTLEF